MVNSKYWKTKYWNQIPLFGFDKGIRYENILQIYYIKIECVFYVLEDDRTYVLVVFILKIDIFNFDLNLYPLFMLYTVQRTADEN